MLLVTPCSKLNKDGVYMKDYQIKSLRELIKAYGDHKTDVEISQLLAVPLNQVSQERKKLLTESK